MVMRSPSLLPPPSGAALQQRHEQEQPEPEQV